MQAENEKDGHQPPRIALTGGIGSGKSTALAMFAARGAAVLSADQMVHQLLQRRDVREQVASRLGVEQLSSGERGRAQLADIVFGDESQLQRLEGVIFPLVRHRIADWFDCEKAKSSAAAVVEIPMLFESGMEDMFDYIVLITAPEEVRRSRHSGRVGRNDFERRSAQQLPELEKGILSDSVFENVGSPDRLDAFVEQVMRAVTGKATRRGLGGGASGRSGR